MTRMKTIYLLHFNDVYNIEASTSEPVGGAARFAHLVKQYADLRPLLLFSGDVLSPSVMSSFTLGQQMPEVLNLLGVKASVVGNKDFDFGPDVLAERIQSCTFPWLLSNLVDAASGQQLCSTRRSCILEWQGVKIGFLGLVEMEWVSALTTVEAANLRYTDFVEEGARVASELKASGAELVVALTHLRAQNDVLLAEKVPGIDIICGGHDHHVQIQAIPPHNTLMVKSGTEFRQLSVIQVNLPESSSRRASSDQMKQIRSDHRSVPTCGPTLGDGDQERGSKGGDRTAEATSLHGAKSRPTKADGSVKISTVHSATSKPNDVSSQALCELLVADAAARAGGVPTQLHVADSATSRGIRITVWNHEVTGELPEDATMAQVVERWEARINDALSRVMVTSSAPLDGRKNALRLGEASLGSFLADVWRSAVKADLVLLPNGVIRNDSIIPAGPITYKEFLNILPSADGEATLLLEMKGRDVRIAIEMGLDDFHRPFLNRRFLQVSGIRYSFDGGNPPGQRLLQDSVEVLGDGGEWVILEDARTYRVGVLQSMLKGKDPFLPCLKRCPVLVHAELHPSVSVMFRYHCYMIEVLNALDGPSHSPTPASETKARAISQIHGGEPVTSHSHDEKIHMSSMHSYQPGFEYFSQVAADDQADHARHIRSDLGQSSVLGKSYPPIHHQFMPRKIGGLGNEGRSSTSGSYTAGSQEAGPGGGARQQPSRSTMSSYHPAPVVPVSSVWPHAKCHAAGQKPLPCIIEVPSVAALDKLQGTESVEQPEGSCKEAAVAVTGLAEEPEGSYAEVTLIVPGHAEESGSSYAEATVAISGLAAELEGSYAEADIAATGLIEEPESRWVEAAFAAIGRGTVQASSEHTLEIPVPRTYARSEMPELLPSSLNPEESLAPLSYADESQDKMKSSFEARPDSVFSRQDLAGLHRLLRSNSSLHQRVVSSMPGADLLNKATNPVPLELATQSLGNLISSALVTSVATWARRSGLLSTVSAPLPRELLPPLLVQEHVSWGGAGPVGVSSQTAAPLVERRPRAVPPSLIAPGSADLMPSTSAKREEGSRSDRSGQQESQVKDPGPRSPLTSQSSLTSALLASAANDASATTPLARPYGTTSPAPTSPNSASSTSNQAEVVSPRRSIHLESLAENALRRRHSIDATRPIETTRSTIKAEELLGSFVSKGFFAGLCKRDSHTGRFVIMPATDGRIKRIENSTALYDVTL